MSYPARFLSPFILRFTIFTVLSAGPLNAWALAPTFVAKKSPTSYGSEQTVGRYVYTGVVPKILNPADLELYVSKSMLTVRAKAWVSNEQVLRYPAELLLYWNALREVFEESNMTFDPLINMDVLAAQQKSATTKAQFELVSKYYSKDNLDQQGLDIYHHQDLQSYKQTILLALLRSYTLTPTATLQDGLHLVELARAARYAELNQLLPSLLLRQLQDNLTLNNERPDHIGYLTFVYPIAATTAGPFSIELQGIYHLGQYEGDEARWHSFKWADEFGGFPFMQYTSYGIALHGPITEFTIPSIEGETGAFNFWYLQRGYVSHGCHRMDPSDLMELRTLLPDKILKGTSHYQNDGVQVVSQVYPDSDVMNGQQVVFNVDYYTPRVELKKNETPEKAVERSTMSSLRASYLKSKIVNLGVDPNTGHKEVSIQNLNAEPLLFDGIKPLKIENGRLVAAPELNGVELKNYPYRGVRIIQYEERGVRYRGDGTNDDFGRFAPSYFTQRRYLNAH